MKKTITVGAVLCIAGSTLDSSNVQSYTPAPKHKPSADVVATYLDGHRTYNPQKYSNNWNRSEQRKVEILQNINNIRTQIRKQAMKWQRDNAATQMLETIACTMENKTRNRDHQLKINRAKELHVPAKYISADILRQRKHMPVVDLADIG